MSWPAMRGSSGDDERDTPPDTLRPRTVPGGLSVPLLCVLAGVVGATLVLTLVPPHTPMIGLFTGGVDLEVYRDGARRAQDGLPLYEGAVALGLLYTYTPFSTLAFVPVEHIPHAVVEEVWMLVNLTVLVCCVLLSFRMLGYAMRLRTLICAVGIAAACTFMEPVRTTLFYGQINLILMVMLLWDFSRDRGVARGVWVGIATGIKLTPGFFAVYLLALGRIRAAIVAGLTFLATIGVAWVVLPEDSHRYWTQTFFDSTRIAPDQHAANQSLRGVVAKLLEREAPTTWWLVLALVVGAAGLAAAVLLHRRGDRLLAVTVVGLTGAMVSPFSWSHHWVWLVPLVVYLVHRALADGVALAGRVLWTLAAVAVIAVAGTWPYDWGHIVVVGLFLFPPQWAIAPLLMNILPALYVVVMVGVGVSLVRGRRGTPAGSGSVGGGPS